MKNNLKNRIDWIATIVPLVGVVIVSILFLFQSESSTFVLESIRTFLGDDFGIYYAILGVGILLCSLYIACLLYTSRCV